MIPIVRRLTKMARDRGTAFESSAINQRRGLSANNQNRADVCATLYDSDENTAVLGSRTVRLHSPDTAEVRKRIAMVRADSWRGVGSVFNRRRKSPGLRFGPLGRPGVDDLSFDAIAIASAGVDGDNPVSVRRIRTCSSSNLSRTRSAVPLLGLYPATWPRRIPRHAWIYDTVLSAVFLQ